MILRMKRLLAALVLFVCANAYAGTWISDSATNRAGTRAFRLYVPDGIGDEKRPLLVAIHGCTQTAADFAGLARIAKLADANRILALLPSQTSAANASLCWNWFLPANQARGDGEASIIIAMIDAVKARYKIDATRVYVAGVSSGGYTTSILLSCYSDVFAAGMVASGGMYEAAGDVFSAALAALYGSPVDPKAAGDDAYRCSGSARGRTIPILVFHGSDDAVVNLRSGEQVVRQFVQMNDWADDGLANDSVVFEPASIVTDSSANLSYTRRTYNVSGSPLIQYLVVNGMAHAWSGGDPAFQYAETKGPDETQLMWSFLQQYQRSDAPKQKRRAVR